MMSLAEDSNLADIVCSRCVLLQVLSVHFLFLVTKQLRQTEGVHKKLKVLRVNYQFRPSLYAPRYN